MTADLLRRAAMRAREVAETATAGPWTAEPVGSEGHHVFAPEGSRATMKGRARTATCTWQDWDEAAADATHIALWHPAVALAVADWLDAAYDDERRFAAQGAHGFPGENPAFAVARLLLGENA